MECRPQCGACCTAPSISTPMPKHPQGKAAGMVCLHLLNDLRCELFGKSTRPAVCSGLQPSEEMCCNSRDEAMSYLVKLEYLTKP